MKEKTGFHIGTGVTSIVMVFIVLCLTIFGVLSFSTAKSDYALSKEAADNLKNYYQIRNKAVREIAQINSIVMDIKEKNGGTDYLAEIKGALEEKGYSMEQKTVSLFFDINEKQQLVVILEVNDYNQDNGISILNSYVNIAGGDYNSSGVTLITE